jgi:hypothetical protein
VFLAESLTPRGSGRASPRVGHMGRIGRIGRISRQALKLSNPFVDFSYARDPRHAAARPSPQKSRGGRIDDLTAG